MSIRDRGKATVKMTLPDGDIAEFDMFLTEYITSSGFYDQHVRIKFEGIITGAVRYVKFEELTNPVLNEIAVKFAERQAYGREIDDVLAEFNVSESREEINC